MLKRIALILFPVALFGQTPVQIANPCIQQQCFFATQSGTLTSSSSTTLTIQQPSNGFRQVSFLGAVVQCPGQTFTIGQSQNGTTATATAGTATALIPIATVNGGTSPVTAAALVFTASNVGGGTAVAPLLAYQANISPPVIDLTQIAMGAPNPAPLNYSVTLTNTGSGSCTGSIAIYWKEKI